MGRKLVSDTLGEDISAAFDLFICVCSSRVRVFHMRNEFLGRDNLLTDKASARSEILHLENKHLRIYLKILLRILEKCAIKIFKPARREINI
ncbi:hypothetical protein PUN28_005757 [Cardiocondyla obscurior]|uniref:Uncharacterized protein n=1 Tax=Cardiocondyla obscurior TaxID=286306 RepID=A0AAW2GAD5_9HYME